MCAEPRNSSKSGYLRPMSAPGTTPIEPVDIGDLDGCAWIDRGVGYTVIAAEPYERLL